MRRNSKTDPRKEKHVARMRYAERQIEKWVKWSWQQRGRVKYKELVELQERYGITIKAG